MFSFINYRTISISLFVFMKLISCFPEQTFPSISEANLHQSFKLTEFNIYDSNIPFIAKKTNYELKKPCFLKNDSCPTTENLNSCNCPQMYTEFDNVLVSFESISDDIFKSFFEFNNINKNYFNGLNIGKDSFERISKYFTTDNNCDKFYTGDYNSIIYNIDILFGLNSNNNVIFDKYFVSWFINRFYSFIKFYIIKNDKNAINNFYTIGCGLNNEISKCFPEFLGFDFENINDSCNSKNYLCGICSSNTMTFADKIFRQLLCSTIIANTTISFIEILLNQADIAFYKCKKEYSNIFTNYILYYNTLTASLKAMRNLIQQNLNNKSNYIDSASLLTSFATIPYQIVDTNNASNSTINLAFVTLNPSIVDKSILSQYI